MIDTRETIKKTAQDAERIVTKETVVLFVDECHLVWGDALGYAWGTRHERVEMPIGNDRQRQTYYGAVNLLSGRSVVMPAEAGNGDQSVASSFSGIGPRITELMSSKPLSRR